MTKDASSSSPGSIVPNTKTASRGRSGSGQDTCAISDTVPPLQAVTRRKLSFRLPAKAPAFPGWAKLRSCSGRPRSAMTDMHSARSWLVTVVASPGLAHFPARMTRQRRCDRDRRPVGPFPAVSPADSAGRGIRRGRYLLVHSLPTSPASPGAYRPASGLETATTGWSACSQVRRSYLPREPGTSRSTVRAALMP